MRTVSQGILTAAAALADDTTAVAVGLRDAERTLVAVWRLAGEETVTLPPGVGHGAKLLYPTKLGVVVENAADKTQVTFPRPFMAALWN
jgi:hypothetical protein